MKYTPPRWHLVKYPDTKSHTMYALKGRGNGYQTIASVKHTDPEIQANNARLMAAAAEMYEALNIVRDQLLEKGLSVQAVDMAIASAEGR